MNQTTSQRKANTAKATKPTNSRKLVKGLRNSKAATLATKQINAKTKSKTKMTSQKATHPPPKE